MKKAIFNIRVGYNKNNPYEVDLSKLSGNIVQTTDEADENGTHEIFFEDGNEFTAFKDELTFI